MNVKGTHYRTIWVEDKSSVNIIDQSKLPHIFSIESLRTLDDMCSAINNMHVRGAGLLGAAAAYGMYLASIEAPISGFFDYMTRAGERLISTRPTAVNLANAVLLQKSVMESQDLMLPGSRTNIIELLLANANAIADNDAENCRRIGQNGLKLIEAISAKKGGESVNILTHCNAGWLAFVDYGTATAPIYAAHDNGIDVHVWVDETRPVNQGARLTAWELLEHCVPHTVIADNVGGHLMQNGKVDIVVVGTDRTTRNGDVANKIGTYLKALAAHDNNIPFYVALPSTSIDWRLRDGSEIPIEERSGDEVKYIQGFSEGKIKNVLITPEASPALNYAFDVTPARLITGLITEQGICLPNFLSLFSLFPDICYENSEVL